MLKYSERVSFRSSIKILFYDIIQVAQEPPYHIQLLIEVQGDSDLARWGERSKHQLTF